MKQWRVIVEKRLTSISGLWLTTSYTVFKADPLTRALLKLSDDYSSDTSQYEGLSKIYSIPAYSFEVSANGITVTYKEHYVTLSHMLLNDSAKATRKHMKLLNQARTKCAAEKL